MIVEVGSAAAVLLGLVFVGLELRQNTEAVEAATFQSLTDASSDYLLTIAADPELSRISVLASGTPELLSDEDRARLFMLDRSYWVRMQNVYSQWQRGTLSNEDWKLYRRVICDSGAGFNSDISTRVNFAEHRPILTPDFSEYVEGCWTR